MIALGIMYTSENMLLLVRPSCRWASSAACKQHQCAGTVA
jgi:hypothetical protein